MGTQPTLKDIREAHTRIKPYIHRTPVLTCRAIDDMLGATLFFKCENLQKVGPSRFAGHAMQCIPWMIQGLRTGSPRTLREITQPRSGPGCTMARNQGVCRHA